MLSKKKKNSFDGHYMDCQSNGVPKFTSAAGFPFADTHSISTSRSSVVISTSPWVIIGGSGATSTDSVAYLDRTPGLPV